jgi:hypothetical protein
MHPASQTPATMIVSEVVAGAAFLAFCACIIAICVGLS